MRTTLELKSSISLLKRLCADAALIEVRGKWSSWRIEEPVGSTPWKRVIEPPVIELRNAGFIVGSDEEDPTCKMGGHYRRYTYSLTDAGRAWLAAHNAPKDPT
ncbi:hypothetical protein [Bradyrhizobium sp. S69]|uniref:hypothetical protein n=1 Tax=Bradyrhizobium sp. S69 TaxID=1641856 RepID=UPI00131B43D9|nr:hypothetical protein [Bradyrhizobium sp. S69]